MNAISKYGVGQRLGIAVVCIGFCLCLACAIAPNWLKAETTVKELIPFEITTLNGTNATDSLDISVGLWRFCVDLDNDENKCFSLYDEYDFEDWINVTRVAAIANVLLGMLCGLTACFSCLCCSRGRTMGFGVFSCLSGVFGFAAVIVVFLSIENDCLLNISIENGDYDWAYIFYTCGSFVLVVGSLFLCFCLPTDTKEPVLGESENSPVLEKSENSSVLRNYVNPGNPS